MVHHHKLECLVKRHTPVNKVKFHGFLSFVPSKILLSALKFLPWYNCTSWLGVKHQLTYYLWNSIRLPLEIADLRGEFACLINGQWTKQATHQWPKTLLMISQCLWCSIKLSLVCLFFKRGFSSSVDMIESVMIWLYIFSSCFNVAKHIRNIHPSLQYTSHSLVHTSLYDIFPFFTCSSCTMLFSPLVPGNTVLSLITFHHIRVSADFQIY